MRKAMNGKSVDVKITIQGFRSSVLCIDAFDWKIMASLVLAWGCSSTELEPISLARDDAEWVV